MHEKRNTKYSVLVLQGKTFLVVVPSYRSSEGIPPWWIPKMSQKQIKIRVHHVHVKAYNRMDKSKVPKSDIIHKL